jgi:hypothetical protein
LRRLASRNSVRLRPDRSFWQKPESAMHMCPFRVPDLFATAALQELLQRPKAPNSWPNGLCQQNRDTALKFLKVMLVGILCPGPIFGSSESSVSRCLRVLRTVPQQWRK